VIEAIKLLEGDLAQAVDAVWVVDASPQTQLQRLIQKRKMPEAVAKQRIAAQNNQVDKLAQAHVIITNDGNVEDTWKQVQDQWNQIRQKLIQQAQADAPTLPVRPVATPAPASPAAARTDLSVEVKRGMPGNAESIASFISSVTGQSVSRMDIMMAFGQKSYLLAQDSAGKQVGVMGWQVENLITRTDEIHLESGFPPAPIISALVSAIEDASMDLQSEVSFIFLPNSAGDAIIHPFLNHGYEATTVKDIKIPAWREAVQEVVAGSDMQFRILTKKLREDRVLQPL
jgi:dephospho-CoA kinase